MPEVLDPNAGVMISRVAMSSIHSVTLDHTNEAQWRLEELLSAAHQVKENASVPLSRFRVGAAVLTRSGDIFEGCNTESLIPVLGVCAERNAINHALIHGEKSFIAVAVVSDLHSPLLPCGTCLQYLQEFARQDGRDILIIAEGRSGDRVITSLDELFKGGFPPETTVTEIQECFRWTTGDEE
ncbi:MAG: cytidine deaminase [Desulfomonile tiedjei]|nr:cytidine deaminase [Desulfomonile tiedjei]